MNDNENIQTNTNEIDLLQLFGIIRKRIMLFLIVTLLIFATGLIYAVASKPIYTVSNLIVIPVSPLMYNISNIQAKPQTHSVPNVQAQPLDRFITLSEVKSILLELDNINNPSKLKSLIGEKAAQNIRNIKITPIKDSSLVQVDVDTIDVASAVALIDRFPQYIKSKQFIVDRIDLVRGITLKNMEDLKKLMDEHMAIKNQKNKMLIIDPANYHSVIENYNQYSFVLQEINKGNIVTLADETVLPERPSKPKKSLICILSLLTGLFTGLISILIAEAFSRAH